MQANKLYYPVALILIILFAGYLMYGGVLKPAQVDLTKYQALCTQYLEAPPGRYQHAEMQMLVTEINYLIPAATSELTVPTERDLKACATSLAARLNQGK